MKIKRVTAPEEMLVTMIFEKDKAGQMSCVLEVDGQRIAKRAPKRKWKILVKGWKVRDYDDLSGFELTPPDQTFSLH